jgi:nucleoside-diphosphate-sugar epimerase
VLTVALFGATGLAGGCVLRECLAAPLVGAVRAVARRPLPPHEKLITTVHTDFEEYDRIREVFTGVDLCLYCLGQSEPQVHGEDAYRRLTHTFALAAAEAVREGSPAAVFHFLSAAGAGFDSGFMWARVKAETERDLLAITNTVCWRPAAIDGMPPADEPWLYRAVRPLARLLSPLRDAYVSGGDIGRAMLQAHVEGIRGRIIENREIRDLADRGRELDRIGALTERRRGPAPPGDSQPPA